jgi:hypothetical protein
VITIAAICPCPPLLVRELTGGTEVLPELRAACAAAVGQLAAPGPDGFGPDVVVVTGPDRETAAWPADARLDLTAYAPALGTYSPEAGERLGAPPPLPLSLGIGTRLLAEAGYAGPRAFHGIAADASPSDCLRLGAELAASAPRVALLALGDGSARRSAAAPGYLDERAEPFDAAVERAVRDGDVGALAALEPDLAASLLAGGRSAWQVLAGALGVTGSAAGRPRTEVLYSAAPLGVGYLVATLIPRS